MVETESYVDKRREEILEEANTDYGNAHRLLQRGVISQNLGGYLKTLVHMRSCLNIARVFAEQGKSADMNLRFWEAEVCLREIYSVAQELGGVHWQELVELAGKEYNYTITEYSKLCERGAIARN